MFRSDLHRAGPEPRMQSRFELLAAVVNAESIRTGDRIGYQSTIVAILRCLDDVDHGHLDAETALDRISEHIVHAVDVDPFDRRTPPD